MQSLIAPLPRLGATLLLCLALGACAKSSSAASSGSDAASLGDPAHGQKLINRIGCGSCHVIPGVLEADGMVGPPLDHMASRQVIAGMLHNTPENMVTWLRFPQKIVPGNAMPDLGLSDKQASDIAAYLYTLK